MKIPKILIEGGSKATQRKKAFVLRLIYINSMLIAATLVLLIAIISIGLIRDSLEKEPEAPKNVGKTEAVTLSDSQLHSGDLLLLDSEHPYSAKANIVLISSIERPQTDGGTNAYTIGGMKTLGGTAKAINALNDMIGAFYRSTKDDNIYISNAHNKELGAGQDAVFISGTAFELKYFSAADVEDWSQKSSIYGVEKYAWIYNNAHKYGFIRVGEEGSSTFRYVGAVHATAAKGKGSFKNYLESLKTYTPDQPLLVNASGGSYAVYYMAAEGKHVVPTEYTYEISGNNSDGYIVTVRLSKNMTQ